MKAIEIKNISKSFGKQRVLNSFSLDVEEGECLAIMGESGTGKSTLAKVIVGLEDIDEGEIKIFDEARNNKNIEFMFQDSFRALNPNMTIEELILESHLFSSKKIDINSKEFVLNLMQMVGLPENLIDRKRSELSGGQLQRVCIARALASDPKIIIFDESLSGLDPLIQNKILTLLARLQKELKLTYIFICHDFRLCYYLADRLILMDEGKILEEFSNFNDEVQAKSKKGKILIDNILKEKNK